MILTVIRFDVIAGEITAVNIAGLYGDRFAQLSCAMRCAVAKYQAFINLVYICINRFSKCFCLCGIRRRTRGF
ncbi:hypothetical protein [Histophilus somni]|uniref:hypothetical protein n=1 Tax=Histophilus somni TaxID=731 RepID=UPI0018ED69AC|nr:hypothetical protein [Histophilus somni]QQF84897.1 hypothetical protein JFL54_03970 [Histophilus somni]